MSDIDRTEPARAALVSPAGPVPWNRVGLVMAVLDGLYLIGFSVAAVVWAPVILAFDVVWVAFGALFLRAWRRRATEVTVQDAQVRLRQPGSLLVRPSDRRVPVEALQSYHPESRAFGTCLVLRKRGGGVIRVPLRTPGAGTDLAVLAMAGLPPTDCDD